MSLPVFLRLLLRVNSRWSCLNDNSWLVFRLSWQFFNGGKSQPNPADSSPRWLGLHFACVLARRVKSSRPHARLPANGQEPLTERLACPRNPRDRLRHRFVRSIHRSVPSAKFRCSCYWSAGNCGKLTPSGSRQWPFGVNFPQTPGRIHKEGK